ncbi:hypothetical protein Cgig2_013626 [Carnegiea gigantea]|uniref:Uncharacterized protein n=1 Tax=Carnegiea gigantea TaxID=171969 RepID=A0A9Q1KC08_9CARY|nr:hypothetical protein Cgig2_013626 [Carnegiea gigantea]
MVAKIKLGGASTVNPAVATVERIPTVNSNGHSSDGGGWTVVAGQSTRGSRLLRAVAAKRKKKKGCAIANTKEVNSGTNEGDLSLQVSFGGCWWSKRPAATMTAVHLVQREQYYGYGSYGSYKKPTYPSPAMQDSFEDIAPTAFPSGIDPRWSMPSTGSTAMATVSSMTRSSRRCLPPRVVISLASGLFTSSCTNSPTATRG